MGVRRALILVPALLLAVMSANALAKDHDKDDKRGNGPAFCRNGEGHPRFGWQWCADRGWDRSGNVVVLRDRSGRILEYGRDTRAINGGRRINGRPVNFAFDQGYGDGYEKGLEDATKNRSFDPTRHGWYRSADRGYESRYGDRNQFKNVYRDGFRSGYDEGFRDRQRNETRSDRNTGTAIPRRWPY